MPLSLQRILDIGATGQHLEVHMIEHFEFMKAKKLPGTEVGQLRYQFQWNLVHLRSA
jgi:hypothetical protein